MGCTLVICLHMGGTRSQEIGSMVEQSGWKETSIHSCIFRYQLMSQNSTFGTRFLFWIERSRPDFVSNRPRAWKVEKLEWKFSEDRSNEVPKKRSSCFWIQTLIHFFKPALFLIKESLRLTWWGWSLYMSTELRNKSDLSVQWIC